MGCSSCSALRIQWRTTRCRPSDRKSTRLNSSHSQISYAVFCLKKKNVVDSSRAHALGGLPALFRFGGRIRSGLHVTAEERRSTHLHSRYSHPSCPVI